MTSKGYRFDLVLIIVLLVVYLGLQLPFLTRTPGVMVDEPWYANTAYNFSVSGRIVNTNVGSGGGDQTFLYTFMMGVFFKAFGCSLLTARLFSVLGGVFGLLGFLLILKHLNLDWLSFSLCGLMFIFSNVYYVLYRSARPEGWVATFIIWGIYFFLLANTTKFVRLYFWAGFFASLSFLCHPHGAFFVFCFGATGLIIAIIRKQPKLMFWYLLSFLLVACIFLIFMILLRQVGTRATLDWWLNRTSLGISGPENLAVFFFHKLSTFISNYTIGVKRLFILIFELSVLLLGVSLFRRNSTLGIVSTWGLAFFITIFLVVMQDNTRHMGEMLMLSLIAFGLILQLCRTKQRAFIFILFCGFLYLANNAAGDLYIIVRDFHNTPYRRVEQRIDEIIPDEARVVSLLHFWFGLKRNENYNRITRWEYKDFRDLDHLLESAELDYLVISDFLTKGRTATSGRLETDREKLVLNNQLYFKKTQSYALQNGSLIEVIHTNNYGDIEIWRIDGR